LNFVYAGNLPGGVEEWENTRCPRCRKTLIRREGFRVLECRLRADGRCPHCDGMVPGLWSEPGQAKGAGPWKGGTPRVLRYEE
jgi:pyruvate formate lyase activating enzyme